HQARSSCQHLREFNPAGPSPGAESRQCENAAIVELAALLGNHAIVPPCTRDIAPGDPHRGGSAPAPGLWPVREYELHLAVGPVSAAGVAALPVRIDRAH